MVTTDYVAIPNVIRDRMGPVEITADFFFRQWNSFFVDAWEANQVHDVGKFP